RPEVARFLHVPEGYVSDVAFGPGGTLAAGYSVVGGGGVVLFDARGERARPGALGGKEGEVTSVAFGPGGTLAAGHGVGDAGGGAGGVVLFAAGGERARPGALGAEEGYVTSVAFGPGGGVAAGYGGGVGGGVVLFDADPASWLRKVKRAANRNFTREEWKK